MEVVVLVVCLVATFVSSSKDALEDTTAGALCTEASSFSIGSGSVCVTYSFGVSDVCADEDDDGVGIGDSNVPLAASSMRCSSSSLSMVVLFSVVTFCGVAVDRTEFREIGSVENF